MAGERTHRYNNAVIPKLDRLHSPDLIDMKFDKPEDIEKFCLLVQAFVGPSDSKGKDTFNFLVCTLSYLSEKLDQDGFMFGRHYLIVNYYDYESIFNIIDSLCKRISAPTWREVAEKLGRYGLWEFEDYST